MVRLYGEGVESLVWGRVGIFAKCAPDAVQDDMHACGLGGQLDIAGPVLCPVVECPGRAVLQALLHLVVAAAQRTRSSAGGLSSTSSSGAP